LGSLRRAAWQHERASTADAAIVLLDARTGAVAQSRRHAAIAALLRIGHVVVAINKMDLVGYSEDRFDAVKAAFSESTKALHHATNVVYIPMSALNGDMVVERGDRMPWYSGPTLLELLERLPVADARATAPFRFPVQLVSRPQTPELHDFRGYMGRIEAGSVRVGDAITVLPGGRSSRVKEILTYDGPLEQAFAPQSVTMTIEDHIDISRGDLVVKTGERLHVAREVRASVCWMGDAPLDARRKYLMKHTTRTLKALVSKIHHRLDVDTLRHADATELKMNDIGDVTFKLQSPLAFDPYETINATGAFILIDEVTNDTVVAWMILRPDSATAAVD
jgi:sulfate adenylyltransferase subunit 1